MTTRARVALELGILAGATVLFLAVFPRGACVLPASWPSGFLDAREVLHVRRERRDRPLRGPRSRAAANRASAGESGGGGGGAE